MNELRRIIQADVALCAVSGSVLLLGAGALADLADVDFGGVIAGAGVFLLVLAAALAWLSRAPSSLLMRFAPWSADGDLAWALASVALALGVSMSGVARVLLVAQAVLVAGVGVAKLTAHRAARRGMIAA